jgi:hypothetical protein
MAKKRPTGCRNEFGEGTKRVAADASSAVARKARNADGGCSTNVWIHPGPDTLAFGSRGGRMRPPPHELAQIDLAGSYMCVQAVLPWPALIE